VAPTSDEKPKQFSLTLSEDEYEWLRELAERDNRSAAGWIRNAIRIAHAGVPKKRKR
jgi:predicted DNA-binding protein